MANYTKYITPRMLDIINLMLKGYSNKEMAEVLNVSEKTIKWHTTTMYRVLGVKKERQLFARVMALKFQPDDIIGVLGTKYLALATYASRDLVTSPQSVDKIKKAQVRDATFLLEPKTSLEKSVL